MFENKIEVLQLSAGQYVWATQLFDDLDHLKQVFVVKSINQGVQLAISIASNSIMREYSRSVLSEVVGSSISSLGKVHPEAPHPVAEWASWIKRVVGKSKKTN